LRRPRLASVELTIQVRANNLMDLIYKRSVDSQDLTIIRELTDSGQAGVTKASVTIVFNNKDKSKSPAGLSHVDEITVCRQVSPHLYKQWSVLTW